MSWFITHYLEQTDATPCKPVKIQVKTGYHEWGRPFATIEIIVDGTPPMSFIGEMPIDELVGNLGEFDWQIVNARISTPVRNQLYGENFPDDDTGTMTTPTNTSGSVKLRVWVPGPEEVPTFWKNFQGTFETP